MATYYWYGGSGNWSDFTNHWSLNSGNSPASPASAAPTGADNVIFDDNSTAGTFTVTVDVSATCADFTVQIITAAKKMTLAGSAALNVSGSWLNASSTTYATTYSGTTTFSSTASGKTIATNSVTMAGSVIFNGVGGAWTMNGAFTTGSSLTITAGALDTNSQNLSVGLACSISNNTNVKGLTLGASTVTVAAAFGISNMTNTTFSAGTSSITLSNSFTSFDGAGQTYYNVSFTGTGANGIVMTGANTFNNLTYASKSGNGARFHTFNANIVVNGTFTPGASNAAVRRLTFASATIGSPVTITVNGVLAAIADVDFRDIVAAGTVGTPWTGTRIGNCGGNSNITPASPKSSYWNLAGAQNWSATGWATTNTGAPAVNNFPLPQDTAVFTEAGAAGTVTLDAYFNIGAIQMADGVSNRTTAFTLATGTQTPTIVGNVTLFNALVLSGTGAITFAGRGTQTITSAGVTFTQPWIVNAPGGTVALGDNVTLGSALAVTHTQGSLSLGTRTFSFGTYASTGTLTRVLAFGASGIAVVNGSGASAWSVSGSSYSTTGTGTIRMSSASAKTFAGGGMIYNATLVQFGSGTLTISGNNTFTGLSNGLVGANTISLTSGSTQTVTTTLNLAGSVGNILTLSAVTPGSSASLNFPGLSTVLSYATIKDITGLGGARYYAFPGSTNNGNNKGLVFSSGAMRGGMTGFMVAI